MTGPREGALPGSRRPRAKLGGAGQVAAAPVPVDAEDLDLLRGQAAAVLAALGRMQLRLDVLARDQAEQIERLVAAVEDLRHAVLDEGEFEDEDEDDAHAHHPAELPHDDVPPREAERAPQPSPAQDPYYVSSPPPQG